MDRSWSGGSHSTAGDYCRILSHQVRIPFSLFSFPSSFFGFSSLLFCFFSLEPLSKHCCSLPHVRNSSWQSYIVDSKSWNPAGLKVLGSSLCQWNLDSGFHALVGIRVLWAVFRIPELRIPVCTSKLLPDSGFHIPIHGAKTAEVKG